MPAGCGAKGYRLSIDGPWDDGGGAGGTAPRAMKRRPHLIDNAHWILTKFGQNIQNVGWREQGHQRLLNRLKFIRSPGRIFSPWD